MNQYGYNFFATPGYWGCVRLWNITKLITDNVLDIIHLQTQGPFKVSPTQCVKNIYAPLNKSFRDANPNFPITFQTVYAAQLPETIEALYQRGLDFGFNYLYLHTGSLYFNRTVDFLKKRSSIEDGSYKPLDNIIEEETIFKGDRENGNVININNIDVFGVKSILAYPKYLSTYYLEITRMCCPKPYSDYFFPPEAGVSQYSYFALTTNVYTFLGLSMTLAVRKDFVSDPNRIYLYKWNNSLANWDRMPTILIGSDDRYYYYNSTVYPRVTFSPEAGYSVGGVELYFAIASEVPFEKIIYYSGILKDVTDIPVQANVTLYQQNQSFSTITDSNGNYNILIQPGVYNITYEIYNIFIPNFWIKLISFNLTESIQNLVNYITGYASENRVSFKVNVITNQTIEIHSEREPKKVLLDTTILSKVSSLSELESGTWFYDSVKKKLYIIANEEAKTICPYDCCITEKNYFDKFCNADYYCSNHVCESKTSCPFECCVDEKMYLEKHCSPPEYCYEHICITPIFSDDFESGDYSKWSGTRTEDGSTISVTSETSYCGAKSSKHYLAGLINDSFCYKDHPAYTTLYVRTYFKVDSFPQISNRRLRIIQLFSLTGATTMQLSLGIMGEDRHLYLWWIDASGTHTAESATTIDLGTWYSLEVKRKASSTDGEIRVWLNGNEIIDLTQIGLNMQTDIMSTAIGNRDGWKDESVIFYTDCVKFSENFIGLES